MTIAKRVKCTVRGAGVGEMIGKTEGKRPLMRPRSRWKDAVRKGLK
jgi:hypothetical protein